MMMNFIFSCASDYLKAELEHETKLADKPSQGKLGRMRETFP